MVFAVMHILNGIIEFQTPLKEPKRLVRTELADGNELVFGPRVYVGWVCSKCKSYNEIERDMCKLSDCIVEPKFNNLELVQFTDAVRKAGGYI